MRTCFVKFLTNSAKIYKNTERLSANSRKFHACLSLNKKMSDYIIPENSPVIALDCEKAFSALGTKEKLYAFYLSRASHLGSHIVLFQTSSESPLIYTLLQRVFRQQSVKELKQVAVEKCDFTDNEFNAILAFTAGIVVNMSNYKSFGDSKFIPNIPEEKFMKFIQSTKYAEEHPDKIKNLLDNCMKKMYSLGDTDRQLGYPSSGTTAYFSSNITPEDNKKVQSFMKTKGLYLENTRLFKTQDENDKTCFEVRLASSLSTDDSEANELVCSKSSHSDLQELFSVTRGDYDKILELVNKYLEQAKEYAANATQVAMLDKYISSFRTGSLEDHKDGSRHWVTDKNPIIETYIGFIETYRDPQGVRAEFEGFVSLVNKEMSIKYNELVTAAEEFLAMLPWGADYEKDRFLKPDYTSLDVLTFAPGDMPIGINIPNYDDIRQNDGFKNVTLGNVISSRDTQPPNFLNPDDVELYQKCKCESVELQTGLHELLGHGSGKMFCKNKDGTFNFDVEKVKHLETGEKITSWYEDGEGYDSVFGSLASSMEECKAECVGLYLSNVPKILQIFGYSDPDVEYVNWLMLALAGVEGLRCYEPKFESWLQSHLRAAFVILRVLLDGEEECVRIVRMTGEDGQPDMRVTFDRTKIESVARPRIGNFLRKLQLYKSTADVSSASTLFNHYSKVEEPFLGYREIVMARKKPRKFIVQPNVFLKDNDVILRNYEPSLEGIIEAWRERFQEDDLDDILEGLWEKDKAHFS